MEKLSWLQNLQKSEPLPAPKPAPKLDMMFSDLFDTGLPPGPVQKTSKLVEDGFDDENDYVAKIANERHGIPTALVERPHADGSFFEKRGSEVWEYRYEGGALQKIILEDSQLGRVEFDSRGNELPLAKAATLENLTWDSPIGDSLKKSDAGLLRKAEISSRMAKLLSEIRGDCRGNEEQLLNQALACLDLPAFTEITTRVITRLKAAA